MIEKVFKREDGTQIQLRLRWITIGTGFIYITPGMDFSIMTRARGKKKWINPIDTDSYEYRNKSFPNGRKQYERQQIMKFITEDELYNAKIELWESIKPAK